MPPHGPVWFLIASEVDISLLGLIPNLGDMTTKLSWNFLGKIYGDLQDPASMCMSHDPSTILDYLHCTLKFLDISVFSNIPDLRFLMALSICSFSSHCQEFFTSRFAWWTPIYISYQEQVGILIHAFTVLW